MNKSELVIEMTGLRIMPSANERVTAIGIETSITAAVCHSAVFLSARGTLETSLKYILSVISIIPSPNANEISHCASNINCTAHLVALGVDVDSF